MQEDKRTQLMDLIINSIHYVLAMQDKYFKNGPFPQLSTSEMQVIEAVELENEPTMSNVANRLLVTTGSLTTATYKIIQKGFLTKKQASYDKRVALLTLTDLGKEAFKARNYFLKELEAIILKQITDSDYQFVFETLRDIYSGLISHDWNQ